MKGFTLIELLVVLIIAGITLGIGVPNFLEFIAEKRILRGETLLLEVMQLQEQYHSQNKSYTLTLNDVDYDAQNHSSSEFYTLTATTCSDSIEKCVILVATPTRNTDPTLRLSSTTDEVERN